MMVNKIVIKFKDGSELVLEGVSDYGVGDGFYYVEKNGYKIFFNSEEVKYIGRVFDIENQPVRV